MTPREHEADRHRLLAFVEQLQRAGRSQREIEAALRELGADGEPGRRRVHGTERRLARFVLPRLRA